MKTINLSRKLAVVLAALMLASAVLGAVVTQQYFPQLGIIKGAGPEDPLEAWSESSVIMWQYNSTFYASRNMSTNMVMDLVSNVTRLEENMLGNMTTGLLYLIELQHNSSLTVGATQSVMAQYQGSMTFTNVTGSYQFGTAGATGPAGPSGGGGNEAYSYLIFNNATATYMVNGTDGTIPYSSTNFTKVWNFAGANSTNICGKIFIKAGDYVQTGTKLYLYSNVTYEGEGYGTKITLAAGTAYEGCIVNVNGASATPTVLDQNITFKNIHLIGLGTSQTAKAFGVELHHAQNCLIDHCWIENMRSSSGNWGIMLNGNGANTRTWYNTVSNNIISAITYDGVQFKDTDTYVSGVMWNTICGNTIHDVQCGIAGYGGDYNKIVDNTIYRANGQTDGNNGYGIILHSNNYTLVSNNIISESRTCFGALDVSGAPSYNTIVNNVFNATEVGGAGSVAGIGNMAEFSGNICNWPAGYVQWGIGVGLRCDIHDNLFSGRFTDNDCIELTELANETMVHDNTFVNTMTGAASYAIIIDNAKAWGIRIYGNAFYGTDNGVYIQSCLNCTVENNYFSSSLDNAIIDSGAKSLIRWNHGYKTEGSASSNNATTTTWTFTMGNASTVLRAYISFNSTIADPYWSATGNTLTVTTGTIIAANNTACYVEWYCWNYP